MSEDYKRAVCNFCPSQPQCEEYRGKMWCGECEIALVCTMTEDVGVTDCHVAKKYWEESLPRKCLLAEQAMSSFVRASASSHGAREGADGFVRDSHSKIFCPRCLHPTFIIETGHTWEPAFGGGGRQSTLKATCGICGLDVEVALS